MLDLESEEKEYIRGDYAQYYDTLQQIGKGAYGCVKMAARKSDGLLVWCSCLPCWLFCVKCSVLGGHEIHQKRSHIDGLLDGTSSLGSGTNRNRVVDESAA